MKRMCTHILLMILFVLLMTGCESELKAQSSVNDVPSITASDATEKIEVAQEKVTELSATLTFLGRASVRLDFSDGRVVYIDPAYGSNEDYEKEADLVLVTHQHSDHNAVGMVKLKSDGEMIQCPFDITSGTTIETKGLSIQAVEAYNRNHNVQECCGFILSAGDLVIYHSGDTSTTQEMAEYQAYEIDYALLCMDGFWNMGPEEAMEVADLIQAEAVIPIHTSARGSFDLEQAKAFKHESALVLDVGESAELLDLSSLEEQEVVPFDEAVVEIMDDRLKAIETEDYDLYMSAITKNNPYLFNEQERWFMHMIDDQIRELSFEILSTEIVDEQTAIVNIRQQHIMKESFDLTYPLWFKVEQGEWKDYGYHFEVLETDRFKVKYMTGETRVDEFRQMLDDAYDHLAVIYREKPHEDYEMKLFNDREMLRQRTIPANAWLFTGWSEPDESLKVFTGHPPQYTAYPGVVQHELVHHITIRICNNNLAVWLLEGIAMYDGTAYYDLNDSPLLTRMTKEGVSVTISDLEAMDLEATVSSEQITNFYNTSYMIVKYMNDTYGHDVLMKMFYEAGKKPFHDSTLNEDFKINNQITTGEVIQSVLGLTKEELSEAYLAWLDNQEI